MDLIENISVYSTFALFALLLQILTELYTRVKGARGDWRSSVLGSLYGLVECTSPKILLSVARVVLVVSNIYLSVGVWCVGISFSACIN